MSKLLTIAYVCNSAACAFLILWLQLGVGVLLQYIGAVMLFYVALNLRAGLK